MALRHRSCLNPDNAIGVSTGGLLIDCCCCYLLFWSSAVLYMLLISFSFLFTSCQRDRMNVAEETHGEMHLSLHSDTWNFEQGTFETIDVTIRNTSPECNEEDFTSSTDFSLGLSLSHYLRQDCSYSLEIAVSDANEIVYKGIRNLGADEFSRKDRFGIVMSLELSEYGKAQGYQGDFGTIGPVLLNWL